MTPRPDAPAAARPPAVAMRLLAAGAAAGAAFATVLCVRALTLVSRQEPSPVPAAAAGTGDGAAAAARRLARAVQFATVSHQDPAADDPQAMAGFRAFLAESYPAVFGALASEVVGGGSLLLTWTGTAAAAPPVILLSHMDVVPISPGTEKDWEHPPFRGDIAGGYIWGRGTLDDKSGVLGLLEAASGLVATGWRPQRTIYLAFGHDEEVGGRRGAAVIAAKLAARGVHADYVLDEGGVISDGLVDGLARPAALIGVAEKGYVSVELAVETAGGHSSTPPARTAIGTLARAVARLEEHPMPTGVRGALRQTLLTLGPEMDFGRRLVIANLWLFEPLLARLVGGSDAGRASLGTTLAATIFQSGDKDNVLPAHARAVVNLRLLPGDSIEAVLAHIRAVVDDPSVAVKVLPGAMAASPLSSADTSSYRALARTVRATYPGTLAAPFLTIGGTDSVHYEALSPNIYRFLPAHFKPDDVPRFHGTNERIGVDDYADTIRFYARLIRDTGQ